MMTRLVLALCFFVSIPSTVHADPFYVRPLTTGNYGADDGNNYNDAWNGFSDIDWSTLQAGNTLYVCGIHNQDQLLIDFSTASNGILTIDGNCPSDPATIDGGIYLTEESDWTSVGNNVWASTTPIPAEQGRGPGWIMIGPEEQSSMHQTKDTDEVNSVIIDDAFADGIINSQDLVADGDAWWDPVSEIMYMYSASGNPGTGPTNIVVPYRYSAVTNVVSYSVIKPMDHVKIQNLALKHTTTLGIRLRSANNIEVVNIDASYLGGGISTGTSPRAGDCISFDGDQTHDVSVRNSYLHQCFELGIAMQLFRSNSDETAYNITFEDNLIDQCGAGISIATHQATDTEIYNAYVRRNTITNMGYGWSGYLDEHNSVHGRGIGVKEPNYDPHPVVRDIYIEDNIIDTYAWAGILMFEGNANIKGNIIKNGTAAYQQNQYTKPAAIVLHGADYTAASNPSVLSTFEATGVVNNNVIYDNMGYGIFLINNTPDPTNGDVKIFNNTFYNNGNGQQDATFYSTTSSGITFKNNLLVCKDNTLCVNSGNYGPDGINTLDNNLYQKQDGDTATWKWGSSIYSYLNFTSYQSASVQDGFSLMGDPLLVSPASEIFHLQATSPAKNVADASIGATYLSALSPTSSWPSNVDYLDQSTHGSGWEMGAYLDPDSDGDLLEDTLEQLIGTDPQDTDTDNDGLTDYFEVNQDSNPHDYQTGVDFDPLNADTDSDTYSDGDEIAAGSDPLNAQSIPPSSVAAPGFTPLAALLFALMLIGFGYRNITY